MARFEVPEGMTVQAFQFTLDLTPTQAACVRRNFGGRRYAYNWAVRTIMNKYRDEFEKRVKPTFVPVKVSIGANAKVGVSGGAGA